MNITIPSPRYVGYNIKADIWCVQAVLWVLHNYNPLQLQKNITII